MTFYEVVELTWETPVDPYNPPDEAVFKFKVYTINYKGADRYEKMTVPPLLSHMFTADIEEIVYSRVTSHRRLWVAASEGLSRREGLLRDLKET